MWPAAVAPHRNTQTMLVWRQSTARTPVKLASQSRPARCRQSVSSTMAVATWSV